MNNYDQESDSDVIPPLSVIKSNFKTIKIGRKIAFCIKKDAIIKGEVVGHGTINDKVEVLGVITNHEVENGTAGTFNKEILFKCRPECGILVRKNIKSIDINDDGTVKDKTKCDMEEGKGKFCKGDYVSVKIREKDIKCIIREVGMINGILCYEVECKDKSSQKYLGSRVIVIENDVTDNEIKDPVTQDIHTYFKIGAYVEIKDGNYGVVRKYVLVKKVFHYLVETDDYIVDVELADVKYGLDLDFGNKAFITVTDPNEFGIITSLTNGSTVDITTYVKKQSGHISWMGFDKNKHFKFGITLENPVGHEDGTYFGQTLFKTEKNCAVLVISKDVIPDARFPREEKKNIAPLKLSAPVDRYQPQLYKISTGNYKGIQGNLNSCYLDTTLFAIFAFNVFLENLISTEIENTDIRQLQNILKTNIVYPLRKDNYVSFDKVTEFRNKLQELIPNGKFLMNERDPEELLETLFHLLTPKLFLLRTKLINNENNEQKCFMTQLFYQHFPDRTALNIAQMLALTFLESEMLISKPPRGLILQLPRHGRDLKKFETVKILSTIDITPFIVVSPKICECKEQCTDINWCKECSLKSYKLIYYCEKCKEKCGHTIKSMKCEPFEAHKGNVELELIAILCIERTHYVAYAKTNEINSKWVYFNSMEDMESGQFIPHVRETSLHEYFKVGTSKVGYYIGDEIYKSDVHKIEHYAFVCFYKNQAMEFYCKDFNSDE